MYCNSDADHLSDYLYMHGHFTCHLPVYAPGLYDGIAHRSTGRCRSAASFARWIS